MTRFKHGHSRYRNQTSLYGRWMAMKDRCRNPNSPEYHNYGGRGISVCERWMSFENFLADLGNPPDGMSLDRIDNDGNYSPENCRWVDKKSQARNRRTNIFVTINGERMILKDAVKKYSNLNYFCVLNRIKLGWPPSRAIFEPKIPSNKRWIKSTVSCLLGE